MSRRRPQVSLAAAVQVAVASPAGADGFGDEVMDAAEQFLRTAGLRRWSVDDVASRAGVGRSTVYRRFATRDDLVHAVLARELRRTLDAVAAATAAETAIEQKVVAAVSAALRALDGSVVDGLLRSEPATFLPYLTTEAGPLLALARDAIATQLAKITGQQPSSVLAEAAARMGLSFVLTRDTVLPVGDDQALAAAVRRILAPLLPPVTT